MANTQVRIQPQFYGNPADLPQSSSLKLVAQGLQFKAEGDRQNATKYFENALQEDSECPQAHYELGLLDIERARHDSAIESLHRAVKLYPKYSEAYCSLGVLYALKNSTEKSLECFTLALACAPSTEMTGAIKNNMGCSYLHFGNRLKLEGKWAEALAAYRKALFYDLNNFNIYFHLGVMHSEMGQFEEAILNYNMTVQLNCNCADAYNNLGILHTDRGEIEQSLRCYREALRAQPHCNNFAHNHLLALNYLADGLSNRCSQLHLEWGSEFSARSAHHRQAIQLLKNASPHNHNNVGKTLGSGGTIRVGYISGDFYMHSVGYFVEALLKGHNRNVVTVICYSKVLRPDARTAYFKSLADVWRDVGSMATLDISQLIVSDNIDILVDLAGHTGNNALEVFAMKPGKVQLSYIGYPNTTGLPEIQYRITDAICDPNVSRQVFTETLVRLPSCFLCYSPGWDIGEVQPPPCVASGIITFGSFNNVAKYSPAMRTAWAQILKAVPNSVLRVKSKSFTSTDMRNLFLAQFAFEGVDISRVHTMASLPGYCEHMDSYRLLDISLDTFPYSGATTTCEALYMGVPVVTLTGDCHAQNVSASLLTAAGLPEFISHSVQEYIAKAVALAANPKLLVEMRLAQRQQLQASQLMNVSNYILNVEAAYSLCMHDQGYDLS